MTIPLSGYLGLIGLVGTGTAAGVIYTNLQNQTPYIDRLFEEIKQDIEEFASRYPSAKVASEASYASNDQQQLNSKEEILVRWMNFWSQLLEKHLKNKNTENSEDILTLESLKNDHAVKEIINKLEKLSGDKFTKIYEKIKKFVSLVEKPKNNDDDNNKNDDGSTVNESPYIKKIQELLSKLQGTSPTTTN